MGFLLVFVTYPWSLSLTHCCPLFSLILLENYFEFSRIDMGEGIGKGEIKLLKMWLGVREEVRVFANIREVFKEKT